MSYTNWESFKREIYDEDDFGYLIKLNDSTKDKITSLLPYPVKEWSDISYEYKDTFIKIIESSILTLQIIDGTFENPYTFPITQLPDSLNYVGSFSNVYDSDCKVFLNIVAISFKDLLYALDNGMLKQELHLITINTNAARLLKLIYGDTYGNIQESIRNGSFLGHVSDNHTNLYKKNVGQDYIVEELSTDEENAVADWTTDVDINNISASVRNVSPSLNLSYAAKGYALRTMLSLYRYSMYVELNKNILTGYCYTNSNDFKIDLDFESVSHFLFENMTNYAKSILNVKNDLYEILCNMCSTWGSSQDVKVELDLVAIKYERIKADTNFKYLFKRVPSKLYHLMSKNNLTYTDAVRIVEDALKRKPDYVGVSSKDLGVEGMNIWQEGILLFDNKIIESRYDVYTFTNIQYTSFAKVLIKKYCLKTHELEKDLSCVVDIKDELKGEALVIIYLLDKGLRIPVLNKLNNRMFYLSQMTEHNVPIKKLLEII